MRAHPSNLCQSRQCYLLIEISVNVFNDSIQASPRKPVSRLCIFRRYHGITALKMNSERTEQRLSEELAPGKSSFEVCFQRAKDVLNLWILHAALINEFHVRSSVILRERLLQ